MRFDGRVYFDFASLYTWHLYRFLALAAGRGVDLSLSWVPFLGEDDPVQMRALAGYVAVKAADPPRHGAYLQAVLAMVHLEGAALSDEGALAAAAEAAGIALGTATPSEEDEQAVRRVTAEGMALGVSATPTIYRNGPVMHVRLNPAALEGDVLTRIGLIDAALADDGVWALVKP